MKHTFSISSWSYLFNTWVESRHWLVICSIVGTSIIFGHSIICDQSGCLQYFSAVSKWAFSSLSSSSLWQLFSLWLWITTVCTMNQTFHCPRPTCICPLWTTCQSLYRSIAWDSSMWQPRSLSRFTSPSINSFVSKLSSFSATGRHALSTY